MADPFEIFASHVALANEMTSMSLSEADTRVYLIDPVLHALGYAGVGSVRREVPIPATREFLDYELRVDAKPWAIVEAKAVSLPLTDQAAAQCVQYASVLGIRWCVISNGVVWAIYDAHATGPLVEKRIAEVDLRSDTAAEAWAVLRLMSVDEVKRGNSFPTLLVARLIRDEFSRPDSPIIARLRSIVRERLGESLTGLEMVDLVDRALAMPTRGGRTVAASPSTSGDADAGDSGTYTADDGEDDAGGGTRRVRLRHLIAAGLLQAGETLHAAGPSGPITVTVRPDGTLDCNGEAAGNLIEAARRLGAPVSGARAGWDFWQRNSGERMSALRDQFVGGDGGSTTV